LLSNSFGCSVLSFGCSLQILVALRIKKKEITKIKEKRA
jgi:hypothetical protein